MIRPLGKKSKIHYDCNACPAYCCSYAWIPVTDSDLTRLAKHHDMSEAKAEKKFTKMTPEGERVLKHQDDEYFETVCRFLDSETRNCTIYEGRPTICREYPGEPRCGYWDFLVSEQERFEDPNLVIAAYIAED